MTFIGSLVNVLTKMTNLLFITNYIIDEDTELLRLLSMIPVTQKLTLLPYLVHGAHPPASFLYTL